MSSRKRKGGSGEAESVVPPQGEGTLAEEQPPAEATERAEGEGPAAPSASASEGEEAAPGAEREDVAARVLALEEEVAGLTDQLLRKQADLENTRKRLARDKEEGIRYANSALLADLIETIDSFERAIRSAEESRDYDSFHHGIVLIEKQLVGALAGKWGLERLESVGQPFDPMLHQAIAVEERADVKGQTVLEEYQAGYRLNGRVLRPAKVKVSVAPAAAGAAPTGPAPTGPAPTGPDAEEGSNENSPESETARGAAEGGTDSGQNGTSGGE